MIDKEDPTVNYITDLLFSLNRAHWANSVIESPCPWICVWFCAIKCSFFYAKQNWTEIKSCIFATIHIGWEIQCLPYAGFSPYMTIAGLTTRFKLSFKYNQIELDEKLTYTRRTEHCIFSVQDKILLKNKVFKITKNTNKLWF